MKCYEWMASKLDKPAPCCKVWGWLIGVLVGALGVAASIIGIYADTGGGGGGGDGDDDAQPNESTTNSPGVRGAGTESPTTSSLSVSQISRLSIGSLSGDDTFGWTADISGNTVVVGGTFQSGGGRAYVFEKDTAGDGNWVQTQFLGPPVSYPADDRFSLTGSSVAIDYDTIVIGSLGDSSNYGHCDVYVKDDGIWKHQQQLVASDGEKGDYFGIGVAISGDTVLVSAMYDDHSVSNAGSAYIFHRENSVWTQQSKLVAPDPASNDIFGRRGLALDGDTAIIGAQWDNSKAGSAHVFAREPPGGSSWVHKQKLTAYDSKADSWFGFSAGKSAVVGAQWDDEFGTDSGSAYVFEKNAGSWSSKIKLRASDPEIKADFAYSLDIHDDLIVIGADSDDAEGMEHAGAVYVFQRKTTERWEQVQKLRAGDVSYKGLFGFSVAANHEDDGKTFVVTAPGANAAYIFQVDRS